jgi:hypothetical protein
MRIASSLSQICCGAAAFIFFAMFTFPASADCTRHLYNKSLDVWAFGFTTAAVEKLNSDSHRILPGETKTIEYITGDSGSPKKWLRVEQVTEVSGKSHYKQSYGVEGCYLRHDGRTGRAVLNDPADGDVIFNN